MTAHSSMNEIQFYSKLKQIERKSLLKTNSINKREFNNKTSSFEALNNELLFKKVSTVDKKKLWIIEILH